MPIKAIRRHLLQEHAQAPSTATIYEWIQKYTQYATDSAKGYHPQVGDVWIADETVLKIGGENLWLWDIIDDKTRFLLATRLSRSRTTRDAQTLIDRATKMAGKSPKIVITDKLKSYLDVRYGKDTEHIQGGIAGVEYPYQNWADIIRLHKPSTKITVEHQPRESMRIPETHIGRPSRRIRI